MGVCYVVFDIDGMLSEFFMNFLNIEICFSIFHVFRVLCCFQHLKKNIWCKKKISGGGEVSTNFIAPSLTG